MGAYLDFASINVKISVVFVLESVQVELQIKSKNQIISYGILGAEWPHFSAYREYIPPSILFHVPVLPGYLAVVF